mgnify:CR=1 FL=1
MDGKTSGDGLYSCTSNCLTECRTNVDGTPSAPILTALTNCYDPCMLLIGGTFEPEDPCIDACDAEYDGCLLHNGCHLVLDCIDSHGGTEECDVLCQSECIREEATDAAAKAVATTLAACFWNCHKVVFYTISVPLGDLPPGAYLTPAQADSLLDALLVRFNLTRNDFTSLTIKVAAGKMAAVAVTPNKPDPQDLETAGETIRFQYTTSSGQTQSAEASTGDATVTTASGSGSSSNTAIIAGAVAGGVVVLLAVAVAVYYYQRRAALDNPSNKVAPNSTEANTYVNPAYNQFHSTAGASSTT